MKNIPEKIYLQLNDGEDLPGDYNDLPPGSVTWCQDKIHDTDIEYILGSEGVKPGVVRGENVEWIELYGEQWPSFFFEHFEPAFYYIYKDIDGKIGVRSYKSRDLDVLKDEADAILGW